MDKTMRVQKASPLDKDAVLDFCQNTFSWGDYIDEVWDSWFADDGIFVIRDDKQAVAMCHMSCDLHSPSAWIEGIRVNQKYRKMGLAKQLVMHCEKAALEKNSSQLYMFIETGNIASLRLSESLGYHSKEIWNLYKLEKSTTTLYDATLIASDEQIRFLESSDLRYVDSWRCYPLNKSALDHLVKKKNLIFTECDGPAAATCIVSPVFADTVLVSILVGTECGVTKLLSAIPYAVESAQVKKIHVLTRLKSLPAHKGLEDLFSFHLVEKIL